MFSPEQTTNGKINFINTPNEDIDEQEGFFANRPHTASTTAKPIIRNNLGHNN